jgi:division protein CdvB (Snf7/Vps24/ESCRT-III family)
VAGGLVPFSILRKFEDRLHPVTLKDRIEHASFKLQTQHEKLEHMYSRIQQRDKDLFQRCVGAQVSNDLGHARIYANECAELRKIAKIVLGSQLALERVILRLETVGEFGTIMSQLAPVMGIVKETKSQIAGIVPQVANELDEVNNVLGELTEETGEISSTNNMESIEPSDGEAKRILEETGLIAEQRVHDHFPDLPSMEPKAELVPETAETATQIDFPPEPHNNGFENQVYDYAKQHSGVFSISTCAEDLGTSADEVRNALDKLRTSGRILIE